VKVIPVEDVIAGLNDPDTAGHLALHLTLDVARTLAAALLDIAEQAMPTTYFQTDSRCELARAVLEAWTPKE